MGIENKAARKKREENERDKMREDEKLGFGDCRGTPPRAKEEGDPPPV
jgi:hypothetical protein